MQTAICTSAKRLLAMGAHCFMATVALAGTVSVAQDVISGLPGTDQLVVGMSASDGAVRIPAGAYITEILSNSSVRISKQAMSTGSATITFAGDQFKFLLIKANPVHFFGAALQNVGTPGAGTPSDTNIGTDEVVGTGYVSGGFALQNVTPQVGTTSAYWSFGQNPTWVGANISTAGGVLWNTTARLGVAPGGQIGGFTFATYDFGGAQTVNNGTLTVVLPPNVENSAILQIN